MNIESDSQFQGTSNSIVSSYENAHQSVTSSNQMNAANVSATSQGNSNQKLTKTVVGLFSSRNDAESAVNKLRSQGFSKEEISIISKDRKDQSRSSAKPQEYDDDITDGALTGGTLGGIGGLLLGAGAMVIPGIGPILAAGPISAALGGAVAGGLAGGLIDWGIPSEVSEHYAQKVAQNQILAIVKTSDSKVNEAAQILRQFGARDVESH